MTALTIRQVINNSLLVLDLALLIFIARHLYRETRLTGLQAAYNRLGNQAALSIFIHVIGLTMIRGWSALLLYYQGQGVDAWQIEQLYPVGVIGLFIALVGMGCCIRIFSRAEWGHWGWVLSSAAAMMFAVGMQVIG